MADQQEPSAGARHALESLDLAIKGSKVYGREDLVQRLTGARLLLASPSTTVYVVGEFKQGKSSLINAVLTADVCPVDDDIATAVPTEVSYSSHPNAIANYAPDGDGWGSPLAEPIPVDAVPSYVTEASNPDNSRRLRSVAVGIDRKLLAGGLVLVDTPGVGGLGSVHNAVTVGSLPQAHAVLFVTDVSQELTDPEVKFLRTAEELCSTILFVQTKIDLYLHWQRIVDINREHLKRNSSKLQILPVSSLLRLEAAKTVDHEMNKESGFPELVSWLQGVVRQSEQIVLRSVANHIQSVVDQLGTVVRSRKEAIDHPERAPELLAELTRAKERAERLRDQSARWQQVLYDGFADVTSEVDYDLRARVRIVLTEAEKAIEDGDPGANWDEFESWLRQRLASETMENYALLVRGAKDVAERVAEHFELAQSSVIAVDASAPVDVLRNIETDITLLDKKMASTAAGLKQGYMGFIMVTMLATMTTLAIPMPLAGAAAVMMGRGGFREDRGRQLERRRAQAKLTVRRFIDDFNLQVGKDSRDALRRLQREQRDGYTERAEELQRATNEAYAAAQQALQSHETNAKDVQRMAADLESLNMLRTRANRLVALAATPIAVEVASGTEAKVLR